jgi:hypothetical protein
MNKGITRLEFASDSSLFAFLIGSGAFAGNPLESVHIQAGTPNLFINILTIGFIGVTTETVLYEGEVPTHQWDGNSNWIPIN